MIEQAREYQQEALQAVSRTFALTIPCLPNELSEAVGNAYLLCRIADTIEDDAAMSSTDKSYFSELFISVLKAETKPEIFALELSPKLASVTPDSEKELIAKTDSVILLTRQFKPVQQRAISRCIRIMSRGMAEFQRSASRDGLKDMIEMDQYCYVVAGVVGEMLTDLFCHHLPQLQHQHEQLRTLGVSFGQGLQMTNILKDVWEDWHRGACWLPRSIFDHHQFNLKNLQPDCTDAGFISGYRDLIGIARHHLTNALIYTLHLPKEQPGMRKFCLLALYMALLTLRKIAAQPSFATGNQVKISRFSVRSTVAVVNMFATNDYMLKRLFNFLAQPLPTSNMPQFTGSLV